MKTYTSKQVFSKVSKKPAFKKAKAKELKRLKNKKK